MQSAPRCGVPVFGKPDSRAHGPEGTSDSPSTCGVSKAGSYIPPFRPGTATALGLVIPELEGRLNGLRGAGADPARSLVDLTAEVERATSVAEINAAVAERASSGALAGILAYSEEPIVSADIVDERLLAPVPVAA